VANTLSSIGQKATENNFGLLLLGYYYRWVENE